jgi:hypothetical protein
VTESRFDRYRQLSAPLGEQPARALIDRLQVLALTQPETLREIEAFIDRGLLPAQRFPVYSNPDRRRDPDRRKESVIPDDPRSERRRAARRVSEQSALPSRG